MDNLEVLISELTLHGDEVRIRQGDDGYWYVDTFGVNTTNVFEASHYSPSLHGALDGLLDKVIERSA